MLSLGLLQIQCPPILTIFSDPCIGLKYKNALNTRLFPLHISFSSLLLLLYTTFVMSLPSSLGESLDLPPWSLSFARQFSRVSRSGTTLFLNCGMNCSFFSCSLTVTSHSSPPFQAMIPDQFSCSHVSWGSFILVLKLIFPQSVFPP